MHSGPPPDAHSVSSTNIIRIGYWPEELGTGGQPSELWIWTAKHRCYRYIGVPQSVYDAFESSPKGEFHWHAPIRNAYPFQRLA